MEVRDGGGGSCRSCGHGRGTAAEETECGICLDELSAHREARLQPRDPNGWGATHCCKSLFHYRCLHTWLNDDSEVETSCGMEPINTACPLSRLSVDDGRRRVCLVSERSEFRVIPNM
mmetsp:Transcript_43538/g.139787  ORF Transcript_43538/g.139787 Transcript_43538/m.139787 type:complete len:118 (+) Transcript_43538:117-470(+)